MLTALRRVTASGVPGTTLGMVEFTLKVFLFHVDIRFVEIIVIIFDAMVLLGTQ
jgi:hypothetical protein